jgi:ribosome-associated protein
LLLMNTDNSGAVRVIEVRAEPIELSKFLKLAGATESGGEAKQIVNDGGVAVNGETETRKGRKLRAGDRVSYGNDTFLVELAHD